MERLDLPFSKEDKILLAVSGGADSMALLDLIRRDSAKRGYKIAVAHLNHGLRKESSVDENLVKTYCNRYGITFYSKKVDLSRDYRKLSTEEAGREARYSFFKELIRKYEFTYLLTAHHQDDQAETVYMRILRGTGPSGLVGIRSFRPFDQAILYRPLLSFSKVDLIQYCEQNNIRYITDSTNTDSTYVRNLIRNEVFPEIEKKTPGFSKKLVELSQHVTNEQTFLNQILEQIAKTCLKFIPEGIRLESKLFENPKAFLDSINFGFLENDSISYLQSAMIRYALDKINALVDLGADHIELIRNHFNKATSGYIDLPNDIRAYKSSGFCEIIKFKAISEEFKDKCRVDLSGEREYYLSRSHYLLHVNRSRDTMNTGEHVVIKKKPEITELTLRKREPGDRVFLSGMETSKKLSRFFIDKKVPQRIRDSLPVLAKGKDIIWIPGLYIHRDFKVESGDEEVITLDLISF